MAFPRKSAIDNDSRHSKFSRRRVILHNTQQINEFPSHVSQSTNVDRRRKWLLRMDSIIGILYATGFFLFPGQTLSLFFQYDFDASIQTFLHMAVRMIAINHLGYVAGLLTAPPEQAIRVATGFLTIGGIFVVYYGQAKLETAALFWSCTILTTALIVAHLLAL